MYSYFHTIYFAVSATKGTFAAIIEARAVDVAKSPYRSMADNTPHRSLLSKDTYFKNKSTLPYLLVFLC